MIKRLTSVVKCLRRVVSQAVVEGREMVCVQQSREEASTCRPERD